MTFISYAQNFEDIMLWRALKHVKQGFYIDVGAAWPDEHSVTKSFYDVGWRGINIEPNPKLFLELEMQRPNDINLPLAISDVTGSLMMSFIEGTGLSTLDKSIADKHASVGWIVEEKEVSVSTLSNVFVEHVSETQEVHFLKVDVEGLELEVIIGNNWEKYRPWIVLVEATVPLSKTETYHAWEKMLVSAGYQFIYADGLNRFYVAEERPELRSAFKYPPNIFDNYISNPRRLADLRSVAAEERAVAAEEQAKTFECQLEKVLSTISYIYGSWSWRITSPLRWCFEWVRLFGQHDYGAKCRMSVKKNINSLIFWVGRVLRNYPRLRYQLRSLIKKGGLYGLSLVVYRRLKGMGKESSIIAGGMGDSGFTDAYLSKHGRIVYRELKAAVALKREEGRGEKCA